MKRFFSEACRHSNTVTLIEWLHYRTFFGKFATILENSHKKYFSLSLILLKPEILNYMLATLKKKEQFCANIFLKFSK